MPASLPGAELARCLQAALHEGRRHALASYLVEHSALPGPRMNLALVNAFADLVESVWIVRENLRKNRLRPWAERVAAIQAMM